MAIPYRKHDISSICTSTRKRFDAMRDDEFAAQCARDQAVFDAEWRRWLSQYDDNGNLKPGLFGTSEYIPNRSISFLCMSSDEQCAYVISEKKRMGML